jgi:CDP-paratose 2-epimerase
MSETALVTGGCGFVGSNVAARLLLEGWRPVLFDNLSHEGAADNLRSPSDKGGCEFRRGDTRKKGNS